MTYRCSFKRDEKDKFRFSFILGVDRWLSLTLRSSHFDTLVFRDIKYWHSEFVTSLNYQLYVSVSDNPGMRLDILKIAPLKQELLVMNQIQHIHNSKTLESIFSPGKCLMPGFGISYIKMRSAKSFIFDSLCRSEPQSKMATVKTASSDVANTCKNLLQSSIFLTVTAGMELQQFAHTHTQTKKRGGWGAGRLSR